MRLWSIHPKYLDAKGLVALWREALLAKKVLKGKIKGYQNHPQLKRFRNQPYPQKAITNYLNTVWKEANRRGYSFNYSKIGKKTTIERIPVTYGQLQYEFTWLCEKLKKRDPKKYQELLSVKEIECHPLFEMVEGPIEEWEKAARNEG